MDPAAGLAHPERGRRRLHAGPALQAAPRGERRLQVDAHDQEPERGGRGHLRLPGANRGILLLVQSNLSVVPRYQSPTLPADAGEDKVTT